MATRIEIATTVFDTRAAIRQKKFSNFAFSHKIKNVFLLDIYTINKQFTEKEFHTIGSAVINPVTQTFFVKTKQNKNYYLNGKNFSWAIEIGFLPGVTDNVSHTVKELIQDLLKRDFSAEEGVYTSQITFIEGKLTEKEVRTIAESLYNPLIQRVHIKNYASFVTDGGMDIIVPRVKLTQTPTISEVNLEIPDDELTKIGKSGISNSDGTRRGPLALSLTSMKAIRDHYRTLKRNPTDIELESIAQTWSEHCKHTIFANPLDEITDGLFKTCIKRATEEIRKSKGEKDFCVSVFTDNSGGIVFDDDFLVTHKAETHNSPSALDPFGGAVTGIVGVNRDALGFGLGAKPVANYYGFCFADPRIDSPLYKGPNFTQKMLSSKRIMEGVIEGVNAGGNQSGIPTPQGFLYFEERYRGKPLVFVGTIGLIPRKIQGKLSHIKKAQVGDYIVMIGGRVGKDGIHGATFSSEAMDSGSPATAVQIGDPITQKKLSDALVKEARDLLLYTSITDNGAGGLSCSVAEMAKESNGCFVELEKVPLKYPGLEPWEIWISESQERMTLSLPKKNWKQFKHLMDQRGVETTIIGTFTDSGKCVVQYGGKEIMNLDLEFLHNGLPKIPMISTYTPAQHTEPNIPMEKDLTKSIHMMVSRLNIASYSFISQQYDYVVQANSVLPPLQGRGQINADTSVFRPVLSSKKGVIVSQGFYPSYSDIDTYHMAASSIDTAVRNAVASGGNPDYMAILDNFCWCSSNDPERLGQLKRAAKACYDYAVIYQTPYISGKDSMFNDFKGYDKEGNPITISIPPTLLISSIGVVDDIMKVVSLDVKNAGDLVYVLGETFDELGASEYFALRGEEMRKKFIGNNVPQVRPGKNNKLYHTVYQLIEKGLLSSSISIGRGGLAVALAKTAMGGMLGISVSLQNLPGNVSRSDYALYSESQGRILVTINPKNKTVFEKLLQGNSFALIGTVTKNTEFVVKGLSGEENIHTDVQSLYRSYKQTFQGY